MMSNDFEEAFSNFLERKEYDEAENALFSMVRIAFLAGWKAAGGEPPTPQKLFELIRCGATDLRVGGEPPPDKNPTTG
jgi:hypothetical protein|nr:hypothetical protein [uncultured Oscillibacter sp.]